MSSRNTAKIDSEVGAANHVLLQQTTLRNLDEIRVYVNYTLLLPPLSSHSRDAADARRPNGN